MKRFYLSSDFLGQELDKSEIGGPRRDRLSVVGLFRAYLELRKKLLLLLWSYELSKCSDLLID